MKIKNKNKTEAEATYKFVHSAPLSLDENGKAPGNLYLVYADVAYDRDGIRGIQRLNRSAAARMAELWHAAVAADPRLAAGAPMYQGHPDYTAGDAADERSLVRNQPPAYGWITDIVPEEESIRLPISWTPAGRRMVEEREYRFFSPFFLSEAVGRENGVQIYIPRFIRSAGLTNTPNWPQAPLVNAANNKTKNHGAERNDMELLEKLGKSFGTTFADEDAAVAAVEAANAEVKQSKAAATAAEAEKKEAETANAANKATIAALRLHIATAAVNAAVTRGAILKDHAAGRINDLVNSGDALTARVAEVEALPALMKTDSTVNTGDLSKRGTNIADARAAVQEAVNAKMAGGLTYDMAFGAVQREQPALFQALETQTANK